MHQKFGTSSRLLSLLFSYILESIRTRQRRDTENTRVCIAIFSLGVCINRQVQNDIWWRCDRSCSETVCLFLFAWMAMDAHFRLISITLRWANEPWYHHKNHHLRWIFVRLHHKQIKSSTLFLHIICIFSPN